MMNPGMPYGVPMQPNMMGGYILCQNHQCIQ